MERLIAGAKLRLLQDDITTIPVDAMLNAANSELAGGGGVDGAIHRAGGPEIMRELDRIRPAGGCPAGSAVITAAGRLPARWVAHAVGPVWTGGGAGEPERLAAAYRAAFELAAGKGARRVSSPAISAGVYGYPIDEAAAVAVGAAAGWLREHPDSFDEIIFVLFDDRAFAAFSRALARA